MKIRIGSVVAASAVLLLFGPMAAGLLAQETQTEETIVEQAAEALQRDPIYVHPEADPGLSDAEADRLREEIAEADAGPVYIAVLPEDARLEAGGSTEQVALTLGRTVRRDGTYAVVVGSELVAVSNMFPAGEVPSMAEEAETESRGDGTAAVLATFVDRLGQAARDGGSGGGGDGGSGFGFFPFLLIAAGIGFFVFTLGRRRKRQREEKRELEEVRQAALDDLVALGDDIRALDIDVEMPDADPAAKRDYVKALECYERATEELDRARRPDDLQPVAATLEEGRYAMASAQARLEGRRPPERRAPCFFDPRHGPSSRDVEWAPPGGAPRTVPACESDARRVEEGLEPQSREVMVDGRSVPYWDAPYYYGPWAGGYFGGFGLFEGLLIGSMLGGGFGGWGHDHGGDYGGGDSGGGDFGGGDFGGGDFGGGDFGGGDFGGGDFG